MTEAEPLQTLARFPVYRVPVDQPPRLGGVVAEHDVLGHAQAIDDAELLVDDPDPVPHGVSRASEFGDFAVDPDRPLVVGMGAGQDLHQRALARAVHADKSLNLAGSKIEVDAIQGQDAAKRLGDALHLQDGS